MRNGSACADTLIAGLCVWGSESHRPRYCLTLEYFVLMSSLIMLTVHMMFWVWLKLRSANICRLVRIDVPHLLHFVYL